MSGTTYRPVTESRLESVSDPFWRICYYYVPMLYKKKIRWRLMQPPYSYNLVFKIPKNVEKTAQNKNFRLFNIV